MVGVDGSSYREIYGPFRAFGLNDKLSWSKDGHSILFASGPDAHIWRVMRIGVEGDNPGFTGLAVKDLSTFDLSPDGSRIALCRTPRTTLEYWVIDKLASLLKNSQ